MSKYCKFLIKRCNGTSSSGLKILEDLPDIPAKILNEHNILRCELDIENNQLEILPNFSLPQFECIQAIYAQNNSIKSIDFVNLGYTCNLRSMNICNNKIQKLNVEIIERLRNLNYMNATINGNKWEFDCNFHKFVQNNTHRIDYTTSTIESNQTSRSKFIHGFGSALRLRLKIKLEKRIQIFIHCQYQSFPFLHSYKMKCTNLS